MEDGFIIMQIGDPEMDKVCDEVIVPALQECKLNPKRVDRDNEGDLLKAEIIQFLESSKIIVADLTNERPNCYLEVGYAMGLGKKRNLILTVREDHHHGSKNYKHGGSRVHFDLEGYDLLLWDPADLDKFREELVTRINRRLAVLEPSAAVEPSKQPLTSTPIIDREWVEEQRSTAFDGLAAVSLPGYMEVAASILPQGQWRQNALVSAVEESQVRTFGWPIGIVMHRDGMQPRPTPDGVRAEVSLGADEGMRQHGSYDYWYMRQSGDFYLLQSLFEDERKPGEIFVDTRIVRTTELLLFLARLYTRLEVPDSTLVRIEVTHGGLKGRSLTAASPTRMMRDGRITDVDSVSAAIDCTVAELQTKLVELVGELVAPLFILFDFFEISQDILSEIVNTFVEGRVG